MAFWDTWFVTKDIAQKNNYKLDLFEAVSQSTQIADMSAIKKYFNKLYDSGGSNDFNTFGVVQQLDGLYVSQKSNKVARLTDYRSMALFPQIATALDTICYAAQIPDENNQLVTLRINDKNLDPRDIEIIRDAAQEYLDLFDFDNNFIEFFRKLLVQGQLCWQNIVAKDDQQQGIIDIHFIPSEAYEFCYDLKTRKKFGIMITNFAADIYNIAAINGLSNYGVGNVNIGGNYRSLNCYQQLLNDECVVLPFEQLTYVDSGVYSADNKIVYSPLERSRRAFNQLMLVEDAILIYRMVRSPEKYVFNVDIGQMPQSKGRQKVAQLMKQFSTKKTYDPATGTVGKVYDPMQMTENFWFVKGADSAGISVETLQSQHNFGQLDDLEYFLKKLYRSLNIPTARFIGEGTGAAIVNGGESGITPEEYNFAKFIMSLQKRFALGLLNGLQVHLKLKGLWDIYNLTRHKLDIIFNPPVEYQQFYRQKLLTSKVEMLKSVLGEEAITTMFSEKYALEYFMGWDQDKIEENHRQRLKEQIRNAKQAALLQAVKQSGSVDIANESLGFDKTLAEILLDGINTKSSSSSQSDDGGDDLDYDTFDQTETDDTQQSVDQQSDVDYSDVQI